MKRTRRVLVGALVISACVATAATGASANLALHLIYDRGFEQPKIDQPVETFDTGSYLDNEWIVDAGSVDLVQTGTLAAAKGAQSIDLDGSEPGSVTQYMNTGASDLTFTVKFMLAGNPTCGPAVKTVSVRWAGVEVGRFSFDTTGKTPTNMGWVAKKLTVHGTPANPGLSFVSLDPAGSTCGPMIDQVMVS
jgi:choice-of-anchor C domain-containing protein